MANVMQEITDEVGRLLLSIREDVQILGKHTSKQGVANVEAINAVTVLTRIEKDMQVALETFGLERKKQKRKKKKKRNK